MSYQTTTIKDITSQIESNNLCLPSIQRKYIWEEKQVEYLFDSIYNNFPIGTFLFWKVASNKLDEYRFYYFLRDYHSRDRIFNDIIPQPAPNSEKTAVLDGQQRMTSLYLGLYGSRTSTKKNASTIFITRFLYFNLLGLNVNVNIGERSNIFRMMSESEQIIANSNQNVLWVRANEFVSQEWADYCSDRITNKTIFENFIIPKNNNLIIRDILNDSDRKLELIEHISRYINRIHTDQIISYYTISNGVNLKTVSEIFIRINSGGTKLSMVDFLFSTVISRWEIGREKIDDLLREIALLGFKNIDSEFIMRTCLYLTNSEILYKPQNFNPITVDKIINEFEKEDGEIDIKTAIINTFRFIKNELGIAPKTIKSTRALIPIIYHIYKRGIFNSNVSKVEIQKFIFISFLKNVFGSHQDTLLKELRDGQDEFLLFNNEFSLAQIISKLIEKREKYTVTESDINGFLNYKKGTKGWLVLSLIYPPLEHHITNFDQDHLHPDSRFRAANFTNGNFEDCKRLKDTIPNLGFAGPLDNRSVKKDKLLSSYINEDITNVGVYKVFNLIDPEVSLKLTDFMVFYDTRRNIMFEKLCEKLGVIINDPNIPQTQEVFIEEDDDWDINELPEQGYDEDDEVTIDEIDITPVLEAELEDQQHNVDEVLNPVQNLLQVDTLAVNRNPEIIAISVNNIPIGTPGNNPNTTRCFKAFLIYCIDNHSHCFAGSEYLRGIFKLEPTYPSFTQATIGYGRVNTHGAYSFHDYQDSARKRMIIENVANELGLHITLHFA